MVTTPSLVLPLQVRNPLPMQDINLTMSCMRLFECHLDEFVGDNPVALRELNEQQQVTWLHCLFLFSMVWSLGANTDDEGRKRFDATLRKMIANDPPSELKIWITGNFVKVTTPFPEGRLVSGWAGWYWHIALRTVPLASLWLLPFMDQMAVAAAIHASNGREWVDQEK